MTALDIVILICFLPAIWFGIKRGLIYQLVSLASLIVGIWLSYRFSAVVSNYLGQWLQASPAALKIASFAVIFIGVAIVLRILCKALESVIKLVMLGWLNRLLGVAFAMVKTALLIGLAIIVFNSVNTSFHLVSDEALAGAVVYNALKDAAYVVLPYLKGLLV